MRVHFKVSSEFWSTARYFGVRRHDAAFGVRSLGCAAFFGVRWHDTAGAAEAAHSIAAHSIAAHSIAHSISGIGTNERLEFHYVRVHHFDVLRQGFDAFECRRAFGGSA